MIIVNVKFIFIVSLLFSSVPPSVDSEEKHKAQTQKAGTSLNINVTITGVPTPKVEWFHGEDAIVQDKDTKVDTGNNYSTLTIKGTTAKNTGAYKVRKTDITKFIYESFALVKEIKHDFMANL